MRTSVSSGSRKRRPKEVGGRKSRQQWKPRPKPSLRLNFMLDSPCRWFHFVWEKPVEGDVSETWKQTCKQCTKQRLSDYRTIVELEQSCDTSRCCGVGLRTSALKLCLLWRSLKIPISYHYGSNFWAFPNLEHRTLKSKKNKSVLYTKNLLIRENIPISNKKTRSLSVYNATKTWRRTRFLQGKRILSGRLFTASFDKRLNLATYVGLRLRWPLVSSALAFGWTASLDAAIDRSIRKRVTCHACPRTSWFAETVSISPAPTSSERSHVTTVPSSAYSSFSRKSFNN